jgi:murein DD-endopeptidase MepM/ murein hydrolase activator NlpD
MARDRIVTGNTVVIEHLPGVFSLYYHLDSIGVDEGDVVEQGERIGTVGMTGLATGPHLHWEIRVGGVPVAPEEASRVPLLLGQDVP